MQPPMAQEVGEIASMTSRPTQIMELMDSVRSVLIINYSNFSGRASRSEFWWFYLVTGILGSVTGIIDLVLFGPKLTDPNWFTWILQVAIFLPFLAVGVRRIHNHGKSGWFILVPFYNLYLLIVEGQSNNNQYGTIPTNIVEREIADNVLEMLLS